MKTSPQIALVVTAVAALLLIAGEGQWILSRRGDLFSQEAQNQTAARMNAERRKDFEDLQTHQDTVLETLLKVTNAVVSEAPPPESFEPLRQAGIQVELQGEHRGFEYAFSSPMEFHRFVPALAALESEYPLLRVSELELESDGDPFPKAATALQIRGKFSLVKNQAVSAQPSLGSLHSANQ